MNYSDSGKPLISREEFDMLNLQAPEDELRPRNYHQISNWFLFFSAIIYIALLFAAQRNPSAAYNMLSIEMTTIKITAYRVIYTLVMAGIYFSSQNKIWYLEKIAFIPFVMALNALVMELLLSKTPDTDIELLYLTIILVIKILITGIFFKNIKNKIN